MSITMDDLRTAVNRFAQKNGEWAGAPMLVQGLKLRIEPRYPWQGLDGAAFERDDETDEEREVQRISAILAEHYAKGHTCINWWYCFARDQYVYVIRGPDGKSRVTLRHEHYGDRYSFLFNSLSVAYEAHSIDAEMRALETLRTNIKSHLWDLYVLCGMFIESSERSGITYIFRKGRPTLAMHKTTGGKIAPFVALCLHPIGYYEDSFCGAMVPTDDILAHLLLMRGDEHRFWKKSNQHPLWAVQSGI